jgi:hypothetical protein
VLLEAHSGCGLFFVDGFEESRMGRNEDQRNVEPPKALEPPQEDADESQPEADIEGTDAVTTPAPLASPDQSAVSNVSVSSLAAGDADPSNGDSDREPPPEEAKLWKFAEALDRWLNELFEHPRPDWRESFHQLLSQQEAEGRVVEPKSRQELLDFLEDWSKTVDWSTVPGDTRGDSNHYRHGGRLPIR